MKVLILGASSGLGRQLVSIADKRGFDVTAVVRPGSQYQPPSNVVRVEGDVLQPGFLDSVMPSQEAVFSALGPRQMSFKKPWRKVDSADGGLGLKATQAIIASMQKFNVRRVCALSAAGVGNSLPLAPFWTRWVFRYSRLYAGLKELEAIENLYAESGLDWLAVRAPRFTDGPRTFRETTLSRYSRATTVSRADLAAFMLNQLELQAFSDHTPLVGARSA